MIWGYVGAATSESNPRTLRYPRRGKELESDYLTPIKFVLGCDLRLHPGRRNFGQSEPQMHISKGGDPYLRTLLVQGAPHILGPFGADYAERIDKLDGAGYGWASALTGRLLPAARETSHLFSFEARRYLLSAWYQRDTGKYERRSCVPIEVFAFSLIL